MALYNENRYTTTLREVMEVLALEGDTLFDFEYPLKADYQEIFEDLFKNRFLMREIGFTSVGRFLHELKVMANEVTPKYNKLIEVYEGEINPLLSYKNITKGEILNETKSKTQSRMNDTPNSKVTSLDDGYLSNLADSENESENKSTTDQLSEGFTKEQIELLDNYKSKMVNIYVELLDEFNDLFIKLY